MENTAAVKPVPVRLSINDTQYDLMVEPRRTLLDTLRTDAQLTGTKKVCDMGNCGACTVLVDGQAMYSCLLLAVDCQDRAITTVEGLSRNGTLHPVQEAFVALDAFQCGFCTPGQIMSVCGLLNDNPSPTDEDIVRAVSGNLCRCGAYQNILQAGRMAVSLLEAQQEAEHAHSTR